jgi:TrmH family RNA methyltransferase
LLSKPKIKLVNSLKLGKFRKQHGLFVAEGSTNVLDFLAGDIKVVHLFATASWLKKHSKKVIKPMPVEIDEKEMKKISFLKNPSEVLAICKIPEYEPIDLATLSELLLMLDDIHDPGNLGTIIRTADWFGINDIICSPDSTDAFNPKVVQASMGSLARVRVHYLHLENMLNDKPDYLKVFGAVTDGDPIDDVAKPQKGIILIGNEARGISGELLPLIDQKITIPFIRHSQKSAAESLNASIATAIICYAFRK